MIDSCLVCGQNAAKYTCPRCDTKTCSVDCVKVHKSELNCDGIRENYRFVPLNKFDNLQLLSDYRFLENASRDLDTARRTFEEAQKHFRKKSKLQRKHRNQSVCKLRK